GTLNAAERYALRAANLQRRAAPDGIDLAGTLKNLGDIEAAHGSLDSANRHYMQAIAILGKLTPSNADYVDALAAMAGIKFKRGDSSGAAELFKQCLRALETQTRYLGGPDAARWDFRAKRISYHKKYIDLLMRNKEIELSFTVAEQSRAYVLLE